MYTYLVFNQMTHSALYTIPFTDSLMIWWYQTNHCVYYSASKAPRFGLNMLLIMGTLLFIAFLSVEDNILVSSEGIQPLALNIFADHGSDSQMQCIVINDSDGYTSTDPTKALGHLDDFREFYMRGYNREDQTITVYKNYNITHISDGVFAWASDVEVSEFSKVRISLPREFTFFGFLTHPGLLLKLFFSLKLL